MQIAFNCIKVFYPRGGDLTMKHKLALAGLLLTSLSLSGCSIVNRIIDSDSEKEKDEEPIEYVDIEGENKAYTIMIYMCGSDLESGNDGEGHTDVNGAGLATEDIAEILSVKNKPDDVNIIIETGGALAWKSTYGIKSNKIGRWHVQKNGTTTSLVNDAQLDYTTGMGNSKTFEEFMKWGLSKYPADRTGVILWNHGGAMRGVCYDETNVGNNDPLLASEIETAVDRAFRSVRRTDKLEWIGYDACLMQVQDIAYKNSKYFNYMVGSEESEAGEGWEYSSWIDDVYAKKSTDTILTEICTGFISAYDNKYGSSTNDQTLSYLDLSKMEDYKAAWENLAVELNKVIPSKDSFQSFMKGCKEYGTVVYKNSYQLAQAGYDLNPGEEYYYGNYGIVYSGGKYYDYGYNYFAIFDAMSVLNKLDTTSAYASVKSYVTAAKTAFNNVVKCSETGSLVKDNSFGLCCYFPCHKYCSKSKYYSSSETNFTSWQSVVNTYGI